MNLEKISFTVNGHSASLEVRVDQTLLSVIREDLGLTGAKHGCESNSCGACTVVLNGNAVRACKIPATAAHHGNLLTIEGVGRDNLHILQYNFLTFGAVQCGFCSPGMIMEAYALLNKNPNPSKSEIRRVMKPHLCRCTGYLPIEDAILATASELKDHSPKDFPQLYADKDTRSIYGRNKVTGAALFTEDIKMPSFLIGIPVLSNEVNALIQAVDVETACKEPGVVSIFRAEDIPGENTLGRWKQDRPLLADSRIKFAGDIVALVIGNTESAARAAAKKVILRTKSTKPVLTIDESLESDTVALHGSGNIAAEIYINKSVDESSTANTMRSIKDTFQTQFIEHALLEKECAAAYFDENNILTVVAPSQNVFFDRFEILRILGLSTRETNRIRIIQATTGAAFGKREDIIAQPLAALATWVLKCPVKVLFSREESFLCTTKRHPFTIKHETRVDECNRPISQKVKLLADTGAYSSWAPNILRKASVHSCGPYEIPQIEIHGKSVFTNNAFSGAMRGFGATQAHFAAEHHMEQIANVCKIDPLELRIQWCLRNGSFTSTGQKLTSFHLKELLINARDVFPWYGCARGKKIENGHAIGFGVAAAYYGIGYGNGLPDKSHVKLTIESSGKVTLYTGAIDYGQGSDAVFLRMITQVLGAPMRSIRIISGDTMTTPDCGSTVASRQTFVTGHAVVDACGKIVQKLMPFAMHKLHVADPSQVLISEAGWCRIGGENLDWNQLVSSATQNCGRLDVQSRFFNKTEKLNSISGQGNVYRTYSSAVACAEVSVNLDSGKIHVVRILSLHDSGKIINPVMARSQVIGGIVMAAGMALQEKYSIQNGIPLSRDFDTYPLPRFGDIPDISVIFMEFPDPSGPMGAKGLGEPAMLAAGPAIVNAVNDALGKRINQIPLVKSRILQHLV